MDLYELDFPIADYCHAVGYDGPLNNSFPVIEALAQSQQMNIPFENFDVLAGKTVSLDPADLLDKLLYHNRGGYCYELNGLFAMLLNHLEVPHALLLARPMFYPAARPRTHMVIVAGFRGQPALIDVAFGSFGPRAPIPLSQLDEEIQQGDYTFKLNLTEDEEYLLSAKEDGEWRNQYCFNLTPQKWIDFVPANFFNSNSADSIFTQKPLVLINTPGGKRILFGDQLKTIENGESQISHIPAELLTETLADVFGIVLDKNNAQ